MVAPGRRARRARRRAAAGAAARPGPGAVARARGARPPSTTAARTAARACRWAAWSTTSCSAPTTAGVSTAPAPARSVPAVPGFVPPPGHAARPWQVADGTWPAVGGARTAGSRHRRPGRRAAAAAWSAAPTTSRTSAPRVVENFLDTSHFAFVHEGWLGDAQHPEVPPYDVRPAADGRPLIPHYRAWQPRASASAAAGGAWVDYRYEVLAPLRGAAAQAARRRGRRRGRRLRRLRLSAGRGTHARVVHAVHQRHRHAPTPSWSSSRTASSARTVAVLESRSARNACRSRAANCTAPPIA